MGMPLRILAGPTGCGKSAIALGLARRYQGAILGADSMQVYRGFAIGTAQPSAQEMREIPHALVGHVDPRDRYDAARFVEEVEAAWGEHERAGRRPMIVGGTGMYLKSLVQGLFEGPTRDPELRRQLHEEAQSQGPEALHARLARVDSEAAGRIRVRDTVRIVRALEVFELTGRTISWWQAESRRAGLRHPEARYVVVTRDRDELRERIGRRTRAMLAAGWMEEVRGLLADGVPPEAPAFRALGYPEILAHLRGELAAGELEEAIMRSSWQYARRQLIWFRGVKGAVWISLTGLEETAAQEAVARAWGWDASAGG